MQGLADLTRIACVATFAVVVCTTMQAGAAPSKGKKATKHEVALVPATGDGSVSKAQLESIDRTLANQAVQQADVAAVRSLDKRVGRGSFPAAVRACKGDGGCLARLAHVSKVELIIIPVAKSDSDGTTVTTTVVAASDAIHRVSFTFATAADLTSAIAKNASELFSSKQGVEEPALESLAALPLEPLETQQAAPPQPAVTPPMPPVVRPPPVGVVTVPPAPSVAADTAAPPLAAIRTMPPPAPRKRTLGWGTYVGTSAAIAGAAGITFGIIEYMQSKNIVDAANADTTLTQRQAAARNQEANTKYDNSRIGLYAGIPLLVAGAALITWDIAFADHRKSASAEPAGHLKLSVMPSVGGAYGAAAFSW